MNTGITFLLLVLFQSIAFFITKKNENAPEHCKSLSPVEMLSAEEMTQVVAKAKEFDPKSPDLDKKNCVLQIISNPRQMFGDSSIAKNANAEFPVHCGIRLILEDGTVYSTGFGSTNYEDQWSSDLNTYFSSINGQPTILDYEEFRVHEGRVTTNIPATEGQAEEILRFLNEARENSIRFNIARQNCMRLGVLCMEKTDVSVDIQTTLKSKMKKACPKVTDIPVIGTAAEPVVWTEKKVDYIVDKTMPSFAKACFKFLKKIAFYLPNKVETFLLNILLLCFGASKASPTRREEGDKETEDFDAVVTNAGDLFKDDTNMIYDSTKMVGWQLQQNSTVVSPYGGQPSMNIVPNCHDAELMKRLTRIFHE